MKAYHRYKDLREQKRESQNKHYTNLYARPNHSVDWENAKIIDRDNNRRARLVREALWIKQRENGCYNGDEGSYTLSQVYDRVVGASTRGDGKQ